MKTFAVALAVLGLAATAAQADKIVDSGDHGGSDGGTVPVQAEYTVEVPAGSIYSSEDLVAENMAASELVRVTLIPSSGVIDTGQ